jgi:hypothetical protein
MTSFPYIHADSKICPKCGSTLTRFNTRHHDPEQPLGGWCDSCHDKHIIRHYQEHRAVCPTHSDGYIAGGSV